MNEAQELRATLIQLAKALETERACVLRLVKIIERQTEAEKPTPVTLAQDERIVTDIEQGV